MIVIIMGLVGIIYTTIIKNSIDNSILFCFKKQLDKLQTLVPKEMGLKVPQYTESRTRWI